MSTCAYLLKRCPPQKGAPHYHRMAATADIFWAFMSLGLLIASLGPSLLGLKRQTGASVGALGFIFTARSIGYLAGSIVGGLFFDIFPMKGNLGIGLCLVITGVATAFVPFEGAPLVLGMLVFTQGVAMGALDTVGNVLMMRLHGDEAGPYMQGLLFVFALGAFLSPLIVRASTVYSLNSHSGTELVPAYALFATVTLAGGIVLPFIPSPEPLSCAQEVLSDPDENAATAIVNDSTSVSSSSHKAQSDANVVVVAALLLGAYVGAETGILKPTFPRVFFHLRISSEMIFLGFLHICDRVWRLSGPLRDTRGVWLFRGASPVSRRGLLGVPCTRARTGHTFLACLQKYHPAAP